MRRCLHLLGLIGVLGCVKPPEPVVHKVQFDKEAPPISSRELDVAGHNLGIQILREGTGAVAENGKTVSVHYVGRLENGTQFDSSLDAGVPLTIQLGVGQVIRGWDLGIEGMRVGERRRLHIPPSLAYGDRRAGQIPPNSTLVFEVELMGVE